MRSFRKAVARSSWGIKVYLALAGVFIVTVLAAEWVAPYLPNAVDLANNSQPPVFAGGSWNHPLGTDQLGRDLLSRTIFGLRTSMGVAIVGVIIGCLVGVLAGLASGYFGGWADKVIMGLVDFQLAVPYTLILLMGIVVLGTDILILIALLGLAHWENYARVTRGLVLSLRHNQYVEAAHASGATEWHVIRQHIVPNIVPTVLVMLAIYFPAILTLESSLSFLGIGIQPPTATLGRMVGDGRDFLITAWWVSIIPAVLILMLALIVQSIGDWLSETFEVSSD